jgi:hypothetical protein
MSQYLFLLLVLACPLMMIFMMRGHGHGASHGQGTQSGHAGCGHSGHAREDPVSVDDLRRQRDELDRQIAEREWQGATSDDRSVEHV